MSPTYKDVECQLLGCDIVWFLSQEIMEASYLLPKNFWDLIPGLLGYTAPTIMIDLALRLLKPPPLRVLIP
jgi:hypothetical protein